MRYAVRCCCQPAKLLGWLEGPEGVRQFTVFEIGDWRRRAPPGLHVVQVRELCSNRIVEHPEHEDEFGVPVELVPTRERAIYSDDRPLEFWRRIEGFEEARE
jgi:hypothetical protein